MKLPRLLESIQQQCPELPASFVQDFVNQMDPDYMTQSSSDTIIRHVNLAHQLTFQNPCALYIQSHPARQYDIHLVAYDYFSEFATFCGALASFGLDIREAAIFTSTPTSTAKAIRASNIPSRWNRRRHQPTHKGLSHKIAVDVFRVQSFPHFPFTSSRQQELSETLITLLRLLQKNQVRQARRQINRRLTEQMGKLQKQPSDLLHPVHITFSNTRSSPHTILDIRSVDTPAFLYTFANALAMREIYLVKARIEVKDAQVLNRLHVQDRYGKKIQNKHKQQELRTAAVLLKEFTHYLSWAPDPGKALDHFDQLLDQLLEQPQKSSTLSTLAHASTLEYLAQLFGSSDYLWEDLLRRQHHNLLPMLWKYKKGPTTRSKAALHRTLHKALQTAKTREQKKQRLNQIKDQELFRIDMRHLLENDPLPEFSHSLTNLADVILHHALEQSHRAMASRTPRKAPPPMAVLGLGKLGGGELGYASDIEILFVYDEAQKPRAYPSSGTTADYYERWGQEFLQWIDAKQEGIFHVDTRLRPYGDKGTLTTSLTELRNYYCHGGPVAQFERQALIKLRFVAGPAKLGAAIEAHRDKFVYGGEPWDIEAALHLRERQLTELVEPGTIHVKYGAGGLIDVEYMVQYLQLMHGHRHPSLRTPNTLEAIEQLCHESLLTLAERATLRDDYLFLRQVIDALRIVRGHAKDLVLPPSGSEEMVFLARRLGMATTDWRKSAEAFEKTTLSRMKQIHERFLLRFSSKQ